MKKAASAILPLLVIAGVFLAGSWYGQRAPVTPATASQAEIVHRQAPMHASDKSDAPGNAQASEMPSGPVHVHGGPAIPGGSPASVSPGAVSISPDKQQLLGVRVRPVEKASGTHTLRLLGRVVPDESRVYRINAGIEGFIREVSGVTTGDHVKKDQQLATFSSPSSYNVIQLYLLNLGSVDRLRQNTAAGSVEAQAVPAGNANIQQRVDQMGNLGMSALQMKEIESTRQVPASIKILAPAEGVVLARNVSPDLRFDRGAELFRIADLRRVWVVADVFENKAQYLRPGQMVTVSLPQQRKTFKATVSSARPQFDPTTRTLKVRLEAENPEDILRPEMFVDVELPVIHAPTLAVPADAILDSGVKKTVFIDRGDGLFEPRQVETGSRFGDRVEIVKGLMAGDRIVTAGTFLLDSESRMKLATVRVPGTSGSGEPAPTGHEHAAHQHGGHQHP